MAILRLTRRQFLGWAAAGAIAGPGLLAACARKRRKKDLNFLNWSGYIGKDTLARFEGETGLRVNYDVFSSEEKLLSKLAAPGGSYDLFVAPDQLIPLLKRRGLIAPMPRDPKRLGRIGASFRDPAYDPGLKFTAPYLWGTTGIGFGRTSFPDPPNSWRDLWDERYKGRISMLDNSREAVQCALLLLGLPVDSGAAEHLEKVRALLAAQRPLVRDYDAATYAEKLAAGELWLAQAWSGDILQAAKAGAAVDFVIPREGSFTWMDSLCLSPEGAERSEALRLVEYLSRPEVAAGIANTARYATPIEEALPLLDPALRRDPRAFPPESVRSRLRFAAPLNPETEALWSRTWEEVKDG